VKVVQINSSCGSGSTGKICAAISSILDCYEIENYIFYSGFKKNTFQNGFLINSKADIRIHQVLSRLFGDQGWHSYFSTKKLVKQLEKINPDIIHLHNLHGYYLNMDVLFDYLNRANKPVIWTLHDCWGFTGHCSHFTAVKCDKWKTHCRACPQKRAYPYSLFLDRSSELYDRKNKLYRGIRSMTVTTVSNWLAEQVKESALLSGREIEVIPNGINTEVFTPTERLSQIGGVPIRDKKIVLGVANNWGPRKGLQDFIELSEHLSDDYLIVLVGLSDAQKKELPHNVIGISRTDHVQQLVALYSTADVYVNPSMEETFGLTTIEAMACGTPAVVYNSTASPELICSATGRIVEPHDIEGLQKCIFEITGKGKAQYSSACIDYVRTNFSESIGYEKYIALYMKLAGKMYE
jgi:putative colanic acid biosynthesis glycosyltransferase